MNACRIARLAVCAAVLLGVGSCAGGDGPEGRDPDDTGNDRALVVGSQGLYSLLALESHRTVYSAPEDFPIEQRHMRAGPDRAAGGGPVPCLVMRPPCDLSYRLPALPDGAQLEFALGVRLNGYRDQGQVRWTISLDGVALEEVALDCSATVPDKERRWMHRTLALPHTGELRFKVDYEGEGQRGPPVGLGILRIALPFEVERQASTRERPNIVLVVVDTLRAKALGCLGNERDTSPFMDQLAQEGALFERAYSSAPWTIPGTASILTGLSIPEHGLGDSGSNSLSERLDTLATVLSRAGFTTAGFSCNPLIDSARNFHRGFEVFQTVSWKAISEVEPSVLEFLSGVGEERFFLYLQPTDPHVPYRPLEPHLERLGIDDAVEVYDEKARSVLDRWYAGGDVDPARLKRTIAHNLDLYDAETAEVDRFLSTLVAQLERDGLADRTLICITADHGEEFLEHGLVGHFNQLYEESVHVPLILWGPGVPAGLKVSAPTENRHVAPTLLRAAGVDLPEGMRGPDLLSAADRRVLEKAGVFLLSQKGRSGDFQSMESAELGSMSSLIEGPWQLIRCVQKGPTKGSYELLFNLSDDPGAHKDLAAQYPERVQRMSERIVAWLTSGRAARPELVPTSEETRQLMRDIGYIGDGEDPASDDGQGAAGDDPGNSRDDPAQNPEADQGGTPKRR
jgi:arylsulfatase